ncbi:hypothetical protein BA893_03310 [Vibrio natriegens]|uniref:hypothetical protein n=1 Tax=Vibrio natriegens TaxID=691 RepID=UPI000803FE67|nr:hypothetical protein [Vibrio natriegens]ANQ20755.1 hypothetical protein BA893_03310 [Vibrio natriegens]
MATDAYYASLQWSIASGISTKRLAAAINVDGNGVLNSLLNAADGNVTGVAFFVEGNWGDGKSHLVYSIRGKVDEIMGARPGVIVLINDGQSFSLNHFEAALSTLIDQIRIDSKPPDQWLSDWYNSSPNEVVWALKSCRLSNYAIRLFEVALNNGSLTHHWLWPMGFKHRGCHQGRDGLSRARFLFSAWAALYAIRTGFPVFLLIDEAENILLERNGFSRRRSYESLEYFRQDPAIIPVIMCPHRLMEQISSDLKSGILATLVNNVNWPLYQQFERNLDNFHFLNVCSPLGSDKQVAELILNLGAAHQRNLTEKECFRLQEELMKDPQLSLNTRAFSQAAQKLILAMPRP